MFHTHLYSFSPIILVLIMLGGISMLTATSIEVIVAIEKALK